jgi:hypothetical protein
MRLPAPMCLVAPVLALALANVAGPANAATYGNARFGYSVAYPADLLVPEPEAGNGDGRQFHARKGAAKMSVWGIYNALDQSPAEIAMDYERDCAAGKVSYSAVSKRLVAFSCITKAGQILYQKTLIKGDVLTTVRFEYPNSERSVWDPVVRQVAGSLAAAPAGN